MPSFPARALEIFICTESVTHSESVTPSNLAAKNANEDSHMVSTQEVHTSQVLHITDSLRPELPNRLSPEREHE